MSLVQATRSVAARTISSQAALASEAVAGQVAQPGGLGFADAVLDAGVLTVPQLQAGELPGDDTGWGVGDERGDPHAVGVGEPQLRAGVRAFFAQDQPGAGRPADRLTRSVASATQAPSRIPPSVSIAGYQPWPMLRVSTASCTRASTG